jgi:hypothetical protein
MHDRALPAADPRSDLVGTIVRKFGMPHGTEAKYCHLIDFYDAYMAKYPPSQPEPEISEDT